ncbi:MAG: M36 family metallopeptidase [Bacteroidota bacterium]
MPLAFPAGLVLPRPPVGFLLTCTIGLLLTSTLLRGQRAEERARQLIAENAAKYELSTDDVKDFIITAEHLSTNSKMHHIYCRQAHEGIGLIGAEWNFHIGQDGALLADHNYYRKDLRTKIATSNRELTASGAVAEAARNLGYALEKTIEIKENPRGTDQKQILSDGGVSLEDIPAQLVYQMTEAGQYRLAWELYIFDLNQRDLWQLCVDAEDGKVLQKTNLTIECGSGHTCTDDHGAGRSHHQNSPGLPHSNGGNAALANSASGQTYSVYAIPLESPYYGAQSTVCDPADAAASPNGWHDRDGAPGPDVFTTDGNNVYAYYAGSGPLSGYSPTGGTGLDFVFPHDPNDPDPFAYTDASLTNLYYVNNVLHDMLHHYGFDEASGNFQNHNYSGLGLATDVVKARGFTSTVCNAFMSTPPDGTSGTMSMYVCNSSGVQRDGNFDNLVVAHEFGHGISKRLVGGAGNTSVLFNQEQMGEGWSDWYGLMISLGPNDSPTMPRGAGTYLFNQGPGGPGIRPFPYSTDKTVNPHTYLDIAGVSVPHGVGSVWCAMLWELTWGLIDEYGYSADFYTGTGGNNIALNLVTEALKLTPNSPGFVDGRDAILTADQAIYGGANRCIIWRAFAKRGLGVSADQGSPSSRSDGSEAFDLPSDCDCTPIYETKRVASDDEAGDIFGWDVDVLGNLVLAGAPNEDAGGSNAGAAYLYRRNFFNGWTQSQKFVAPDATAGDQFGRSVAISKIYVAIGAPYTDDNGSSSGSVYIYKYYAGTYVFHQELKAWDAAAFDNFGISVAMTNNRLIVGASGNDDLGSNSGSVYAFELNSAGYWQKWDKYNAADGSANDLFGWSLDIDGDHIVIGAFTDDHSGATDIGSAYVFSRPSASALYTEVDKLTASDGSDYQYFGYSVAVDNSNIVVGAFHRISTQGGAAYVYNKEAGTNSWPEAQKLVPDDNAAGDFFGLSVSLNDNRAVIGATGDDDDGLSSGSAYVYDYFAGYWCMTNKLTANDAAAADQYGVSVANTGNYIAVGAPFNDDGGLSSGSIYIYGCTNRYPPYEQLPEYEYEQEIPPIGLDGGSAEALSVDLYPNPNPGNGVQLAIRGWRADQDLTVSVYDAFGKLVHHQLLGSDRWSTHQELYFDQQLAQGLYTVLVEMQGQQILQKLVINE